MSAETDVLLREISDRLFKLEQQKKRKLKKKRRGWIDEQRRNKKDNHCRQSENQTLSKKDTWKEERDGVE